MWLKQKSSIKIIKAAEENVIRELYAKEPCVIVGRQANAVLKGYRNVINIFISADMDGNSIEKINKPVGNYSIVIGNEGNGVSQELIEISDMIVSIPMQNNVESLNASVSASILMFNLK